MPLRSVGTDSLWGEWQNNRRRCFLQYFLKPRFSSCIYSLQRLLTSVSIKLTCDLWREEPRWYNRIMSYEISADRRRKSQLQDQNLFSLWLWVSQLTFLCFISLIFIIAKHRPPQSTWWGGAVEERRWEHRRCPRKDKCKRIRMF